MSKKTKEAVDSDKKSIDMMNLNELREIKSEELQKIALDLNLIDDNSYAFCWIVDYPIFEKDEITIS